LRLAHDPPPAKTESAIFRSKNFFELAGVISDRKDVVLPSRENAKSMQHDEFEIEVKHRPFGEIYSIV
jgi:hypothetical protein